MITSQDLIVIGFLVFLEGILSIDNALVLALLARNLPPHLQRKALTYGLAGAVVFRLAALFVVTQLLQWRWVKLVGGGYLIFIAAKHFLSADHREEEGRKPISARSFWKVVLVIELTDIAFAVDSILAAVALSQKFWVVFTGGMLGVLMMRFAASLFITVLKRFPSFETTAYLLVFVIGAKVFLEYFQLSGVDFHSGSSPWFWGFWGVMAACTLYGFKPRRWRRQTEAAVKTEADVAEKLQ